MIFKHFGIISLANSRTKKKIITTKNSWTHEQRSHIYANQPKYYSVNNEFLLLLLLSIFALFSALTVWLSFLFFYPQSFVIRALARSLLVAYSFLLCSLLTFSVGMRSVRNYDNFQCDRPEPDLCDFRGLILLFLAIRIHRWSIPSPKTKQLQKRRRNKKWKSLWKRDI